jgi:arylsulfatase A-like enzyme
MFAKRPAGPSNRQAAMTTTTKSPGGRQARARSSAVDRRSLLRNGASLAALLAAGAVGYRPARAQQTAAGPSSRQPNIVVILADDLGSADLGYRGSDIKTPNIDALARGGVRLESFYGMSASTPGRAALMTGRYPMRYGLQTMVISPSQTYGLPAEERTLAQALKEAGYRTAMVGKWHLGHADQKYWPQNRGFDHFYGNLLGEVDHLTKEIGGLVDWQRNGQSLKENGYSTTLIGNEAVRIIEADDGSKPLFLFAAFSAPHAPFQAPPDYVDRYKSIADEKRRTYAAMVTALDDQVGRIVAALDKKGLRDNTVIVFASANGGARTPASNGDFRDGKGSLHEGGVRVPAIVNWPGKIKPGVSNEPLHMVDLMPTLLTLAGARGSNGRPFDGKDIWATIASGAPSPHEDILINVESFRGALRKGDWKVVKVYQMPGTVELFDLASDPGEKNNVAPQHWDLVHELEARLGRYARDMEPSKWFKAQPALVDAQGRTVFEPGFVIEDSGVPGEKPALPGVGSRALR